MEMRLKERLIGAIVLVLAAVIFIPMLLDGPGRNRQVSQSVPLPDAGGKERRTVRMRLDGSDAPESVAESDVLQQQAEPVSIDLTPAQEPVESERTSQPRVATSHEESAKPEAPGPVTDSKPADAPWTVQVGSFSSRDNAESLAGDLLEIGYPAYIREFRDDKGVHYRVRTGGFPSRDAAQREADAIRSKTGEPARPASRD